MKYRITVIFGLVIIVGTIIRLSFLQSKPEAKWDPSPDTLIIEIARHGFEIDRNYIPDMRLWGDGRVVWVEYEGDSLYGKRRIMEGQLTPQEMRKVINRFIEAGFFDRRLSDFLAAGPVSTSLTVNLLNDSRFRGFESYEIPKEFRELSDYLMVGAGAQGVEIMPTRGHLTVYTAKESGCRSLEAKYQWPKESFGYNLGELRESDSGLWVEDDELAYVWQIVNENFNCPLVEADGIIYKLTLTIPKLSYIRSAVQ